MTTSLRSTDHGTTVVTVTVGKHDSSSKSNPQTFTIHKNLLCLQSKFFDNAFNSDFKEAEDLHMDSPEDYPETFEVLYRWLYSGQIESVDFYTTSGISPALFWFLVYAMADRLLVTQLQAAAFGKLKEIFSDSVQVVPPARLVVELFGRGQVGGLLESYLVRHSAFWLVALAYPKWLSWEKALTADERFGVAVAVQIAKLGSKEWTGSRLHPCLDMDFDGYATVEAVDVEEDESDYGGVAAGLFKERE